MDVSDVMKKMPSTVEEAEEQNRRLAAALKLVDVNADGAADTIKQYRDRMEENKEMIESVTGSNEEYTDSVLSILGVNANFGSSIQALANSGGHSFIDGLNTKVKAFGKTLLGLCANPWVLALLGITAVASGVKWWYDYNKGLVEATKLTKDFTGLSGGELKAVRNEVQAVADIYGKDFKEVMVAANAMSKQFGISIQESLKLMEDGFASGADVNGEFLENVKEYPAYFKEAGLSASEFVAITTQANKAGIYSDKGIDVIKEGNLRIREMTTATKEALEGIGISSEQVMQDLANGSKSTFDVMQDVSAKLAEFPATSSEVGTAIADIFGGPGEDAGLQYLLTLKDIDNNLDNVKEEAGELAKLQEEQLQSQIELENAIASVFDATGGSFEHMTTTAKTFINKGIVKIIEGCVGIVNWFIRLYNKSIAVRVAFQNISLQFKTMWEVCKLVVNNIITAFKALGKCIEGVFTLDFDKVAQGWNKGMSALGANFSNFFNNLKNNAQGWMDEVLDGEMKEFTFDVKANVTTSGKSDTPKNNGGGVYKPKQTDEQKKQAEKQAKEQLKILQELEDSKVELMEDGHEKELANIRLNYKKKIDTIKGNSEQEKQLRSQLVEQMMNELAECELKYQKELAKINLANRLATVKKGSKEELDLKLAQIEANRKIEIEAAKKTGADVNLINAKFNQQRLDLENDYAGQQAERIFERFSADRIIEDKAYSDSVNALKNKYAQELALAKGNNEKQEEFKRKLDADIAQLDNNYARGAINETIRMYEEILALDSLSVEDRARFEEELLKSKIDANNLAADSYKDSVERQIESDERLKQKRLENLNQWLSKSGEIIGAIAELASALYDGQIQKIEEQQEANNEAGEAEQERIAQMVEQNVITTEEGEARKRAAEDRTAQKNEELEKKKQELKHKQAMWDKANSIAQCVIDTSLAIMMSMATAPFPVNIALAATAGVMGALQLATIIATPIPKYAKGTKHHGGGLAIVGDGGQSEVVLFNNSAWLTPDTPTLVDIPVGASVIPSVQEFDENIAGVVNVTNTSDSPYVVVNNDYQKLEEKMDRIIYLFTISNRSRRGDETNMFVELLKHTRL